MASDRMGKACVEDFIAPGSFTYDTVLAWSSAAAQLRTKGGSSVPGDLEAFTCNICGARNRFTPEAVGRDNASCTSCRSSMRFRSVALVLSRALFGMDLQLRDFPNLKSLRGLGISDSDIYSAQLEKCFSYTNTYYHREPVFDLLNPDEGEFNKFDFVICSDVLEHIPHPVDQAFTTLSALLKNAGVLILTVPYTLEANTIEHFDNVMESAVVDMNGKLLVVTRRASGGAYQVSENVVFHGGQGSTQEMRVFSQPDLERHLVAAGLREFHFETKGNRSFGIVLSAEGSVPIVASKSEFCVGRSAIRELVEQINKHREILRAVRKSRLLRFGGTLGLGPKIP
jgi:hypothetical protein